jgi:dienelactone hydrolase
MNHLSPKFFLALCFLTLMNSLNAEPSDKLVAGQNGRVEFLSSTPVSRWSLARSRPVLNVPAESPIVVWGDLLLPPKRPPTAKVGAVIISHGSEGVNSLYYDVWAKALMDSGMAVFIVDSQKPRNVKESLRDKQLSWNTTGNISDGLHALKILATHPDIDSSRIFHIGFSRGANASYASAWPIYQRAVLQEGLRYAGNIAVYPGCNIRYHEELTATNPAPLLLLLGEKDDMTPATPCVEYAQQLAKAGHDVRYKVYAGAYHVFDRLSQPYQKFKEGTFADCFLEHTVTDNRTAVPIRPWGNYRTGEQFTRDDQWMSAIKNCGKEKWITVESNPTARRLAVEDVLAFIGAIR